MGIAHDSPAVMALFFVTVLLFSAVFWGGKE